MNETREYQIHNPIIAMHASTSALTRIKVKVLIIKALYCIYAFSLYKYTTLDRFINLCFNLI
jgi:hypothetical protein